MTKKIIIISFLVLIVAVLSWWQFYRVGPSQGGVGSLTETKVAKYTPPIDFPSQTRKGFCFNNSLLQPYRDDTWRCRVDDQVKDPCFYVASQDTMLCDVNPFSQTAGFKLQLSQGLPVPQSMPPAKDNWGWLVLLEDDTVCSPFAGTIPVLDGKTAAFGCVSTNSAENIVLLGDLKIGKIWTATKAVFTIEDGKPVIKSNKEVNVREVWQ